MPSSEPNIIWICRGSVVKDGKYIDCSHAVTSAMLKEAGLDVVELVEEAVKRALQ